MDIRPTMVERAYQLASSGRYPTVAEIKARLRWEGYEDRNLVGPLLMASLRRLCAAARKAS